MGLFLQGFLWSEIMELNFEHADPGLSLMGEAAAARELQNAFVLKLTARERIKLALRLGRRAAALKGKKNGRG